MAFKLGRTVDLYHIYSFWWPWPWCKVTVGRQRKKFSVISTSKQVISIKLATSVRYFLHDLDCDFENIYMTWPACFTHDIICLPAFMETVLLYKNYLSGHKIDLRVWCVCACMHARVCVLILALGHTHTDVLGHTHTCTDTHTHSHITHWLVIRSQIHTSQSRLIIIHKLLVLWLP